MSLPLRRGARAVTGSRAAGFDAAAQTRAAIAVSHLRKAYGATVAVDDVSFSVAEGEIFGILGPNGAGKTTTVECVIGLRTPDAGRIRVLGPDPRVDRAELHAIVGAQFQGSTLPPRLAAIARTQSTAGLLVRAAWAVVLAVLAGCLFRWE